MLYETHKRKVLTAGILFKSVSDSVV